MTYDEHSIQILSEDEAADRFLFARTEQIAQQYPAVSTRFISRLIEACQLSGWDLDKAARRYCCSDRTIQAPQGFLDVYRALMPERGDRCLERLTAPRISKNPNTKEETWR